MRQKYTKPMVEIERFRLTQQLTGCSFLKIGSGDYICIMKDPDAPDEMKRLARVGYFVDNTSCTKSHAMVSDYIGICWNTSINMAFTS